MTKNLVLWVVLAVVLMSVFNTFSPRTGQPTKIEYSEFVARVKQGDVERVMIEGRDIHGVSRSESQWLARKISDLSDSNATDTHA